MSLNGTNRTKSEETEVKLYKILESLKHTDYELTSCITQLQQLLLGEKHADKVVLALFATVYAGDDKKTEKRGVLGLGYGYAGGYGHGLGYGHGHGLLGHSVAVAAPVAHSVAYSSVDHGYYGGHGHGLGYAGHGIGLGHGLGYSHGLGGLGGLGHGYVAAPIIKTIAAPVVTKTYVAPVSYASHGIGLGHGYGLGYGGYHGGYAGYGGYGGHGGYGGYGGGYYGGHGGHGW